MNRHSFTFRTKAANYKGRTYQVTAEKGNTKRCLTLMPYSGISSPCLMRMPLEWHWQPMRRLCCLTLMPMEWQCMAVHEKAALFNEDAHEVVSAAREEAASALFNADAHGVAVHMAVHEKAALFNADAHEFSGIL